VEQEFRELHSKWLQSRKEEEERNETAAEDPAGEADTPIAFVPRDLPTAQIGVDGDSSASQAAQPPSAGFSPTLSVSTTSDLTPSELDEETAEGSDERIPSITHHEEFYLEDGDVEIVCEHTIFRAHSSIVSFSSSRLRDLLSKSTLGTSPPQGCHRVVFEDSADDFSVLLKMIYTPG
jgi:hypothetical protein